LSPIGCGFDVSAKYWNRHDLKLKSLNDIYKKL
jgi:hypothetical protein